MNETTKNWAIFLAASLCVVAGVYGFYYFAESALALRMLIVLAGLAVASAVVYASTPGKEFVQFARESIDEGKKVAWPTRKETIQMTLIVFAFAIIMAIFLGAVDAAIGAGISWITKRN
jgi:preprotein translocase subunit SecE